MLENSAIYFIIALAQNCQYLNTQRGNICVERNYAGNGSKCVYITRKILFAQVNYIIFYIYA